MPDPAAFIDATVPRGLRARTLRRMKTSLEIRHAFEARLAEEGLRDYRLLQLVRWIRRLDDEDAAEAIAMVEVALDSPRRRRAELLWLIDHELRRSRDTLPQRARLAFLRWVAR